MSISRRQFLGATLSALAARIASATPVDRPIAGAFVDASHQRGHRIRDQRSLPGVAETHRVPLVIVGGGVAGLSAAWRLHKRGFHDFVVLEMAEQVGGNARWGDNDISAYPWGAHYVPVPNTSAVLVRELFADLGVWQHGQWEPQYLCAPPQERLFLHGRWQEDIAAVREHSTRERDQWRRFTARMQQLRATGQFTIPMELGATPSPLDRVSFADWCRQEHFDAPFLTWYLNYACRDDYGAMAAETSAWAGIHYFASREYDELGPLTWPEGNGWIVRRLLDTLQGYVRPATMVQHITTAGSRLCVWTDQGRYLTEVVIFAAPSFLAPYIVEGMPPLRHFVYSPWLTANLTLERRPCERGVSLAWDNALYDSPTLGYVVATH